MGRSLCFTLLVLVIFSLVGCDGSNRYKLVSTTKVTLSIDDVDYKLEPYSKENDITKGELELLWDKNTNTTFLLTITNNSKKSVSVKASLATLIDSLGNTYTARNLKLIPKRTDNLYIGAAFGWPQVSIVPIVPTNDILGKKDEPSNEYKQAVNSQDVMVEPNFKAQIIINFFGLEDKVAHITVNVPNDQNSTGQENIKWEYDVKF